MVVDLDKLIKPLSISEFLSLLKSRRYSIDGKIHGNNIGIALEHRESSIEVMNNHRVSIKFGKNITSVGFEQLIEICDKAGYWFVVNRCRHTKVEIDFWVKM